MIPNQKTPGALKDGVNFHDMDDCEDPFNCLKSKRQAIISLNFPTISKISGNTPKDPSDSRKNAGIAMKASMKTKKKVVFIGTGERANAYLMYGAKD